MTSWKRDVSPLVLAALLLTLTPHAWATTYTLSGATYASGFGVYHNITGITGLFTTASPLPPNLNGVAIAGSGGLGLVTSWSFNDGVFTYTDANSDLWQNGVAAAHSFSVSTDSAGNITGFFIVLTMPKSGAVVGQPTEFMFLGESGPGGADADRSNCVVVAPDGSCQGYDGNVSDAAFSTDPGTATFSASCKKLNKKGLCKTSKKHP